MLHKQILAQKNFSGGLVTKASELALKIEQSPDVLNCHSDLFQSLKKRNGYTKLNSGSASATLSGMYNYQRDDAFQFLVSMWDGSSLKKMDNAGHAWVTGDDATPTLGAGAYLKVTVDSTVGNWVFDDIDLRSFPADCQAVADAINDATTTTGLVFTAVARAFEDTSGFINIVSKTSGTVSKIDVADGTTDAGDATGEATQALFAGTTATDTGSAAAWDGTWDNIGANANKGTAFSAGSTEYPYFTSMDNDCIITTEYRDVPQKWDMMDNEADHVDIDWETSHCYVVGDDASISAGDTCFLKVTIDSTAYDDIDISDMLLISDVVDAINTDISAKGWAYEDVNGYLRIISNTRGADGSVAVEDGASDAGTAEGEATELLFSGTTATGTTITANIAPEGKYCINWHDYCWIANTAANPDRIYFSASTDPTSWTATDFQDIITPGDVGITGIGVLRGNLYVFKKWSIHRITYLGGIPLYNVQEIKSTIGTSSPRSIKNVEVPGEAGGELIGFLGSDQQIYKFNGGQATPVGEPISTYNGITSYCLRGDGLTYGINPDQLNEVWAVNYPERHWFMLFFPKDNDTVCKDAFIFDYYGSSFWPFHFDDTVPAGCFSDNTKGQRKIYFGGTNFVWLFDSGNDDDSDAINAYWTSPKLDAESEVNMKDIRRWCLSEKSVACTPVFTYRCDWESSYSSGETLKTAQVEHTYDIPRFQELFQWKLTDNSTDAAFELYRVSIVSGMKRGQAK